jgi:hypothetical protein
MSRKKLLTKAAENQTQQWQWRFLEHRLKNSRSNEVLRQTPGLKHRASENQYRSVLGGVKCRFMFHAVAADSNPSRRSTHFRCPCDFGRLACDSISGPEHGLLSPQREASRPVFLLEPTELWCLDETRLAHPTAFRIWDDRHQPQSLAAVAQI